MFRLGEDLALRLPRRAVGAELIATEQRWLPGLAAALPLPVPAPLRTGSPALGYPWPWSVTPWLPGVPAAQAPLKADQAKRLGGFLKALHRPAPTQAPFNPYRSIPLAGRTTTEPTMARVAKARPGLIDEVVREAWRAGLAAEVDVAPTWIHGDLHARNVLSEAGVVSGVIDWGDMARGDPATDLYGLWMLLPDATARAAALAAYGGVSAATLARARGWAVAMGVVLVEAGSTLRALREGP
jgi:aminoglycoside phosphotransferase (APT) family kinase protein